jgi:hypothetical protein
VRISDNDLITNLTGLGALTAVTGSLSIYGNPMLQQIDDLVSLTSIGQSLTVGNNELLTNIDGLAGMRSAVRGSLSITRNHSLVDVDGLSGISGISSTLRIHDNDALVNLGGLSNLQTVGQSLEVTDNAVLPNVDGLSSIFSFGRTVVISNNEMLTNVNGLSGLRTYGDGYWATSSMEITNNILLTSCRPGLFPLLSGNHAPHSVEMNGNAADGDCNNDGADVVSVGTEDNVIAAGEARIESAYPNPLSHFVSVAYHLPKNVTVTIFLVDVLGRRVRRIESGVKTAGKHQFTLSTSDLPSGLYFCVLEAGSHRDSLRLVIRR